MNASITGPAFLEINARRIAEYEEILALQQAILARMTIVGGTVGTALDRGNQLGHSTGDGLAVKITAKHD